MHVLRRAVFDFVLYKGSGKHKIRWQKATRYIFEEFRLDGEGLTFSEVCGLFGWEPSYLQRKAKELTRSKIKKLETSKFREDLDDTYVEVVDRVLNWPSINAPTPFMLPYHYNEECREELRLRVVKREPVERHVSFIPLAVFSPSPA